MKLLKKSSSSNSLPQVTTLSKTSPIQRTSTIRPQISMIWVSESDGNRQRLVARWVTQG